VELLGSTEYAAVGLNLCDVTGHRTDPQQLGEVPCVKILQETIRPIKYSIIVSSMTNGSRKILNTKLAWSYRCKQTRKEIQAHV
jgi:hypothetical protein